MSTQRLGCLSPLAMISALIALVLIVVAEITSGNLMFSPGALNAEPGEPLGGVSSHAEIGKECGLCHTPFWTMERMSHRCLDCHTSVQVELGVPSTLHGALARNSTLYCQSCHTEHNGSTASLTVVDGVRFPHDATGFALTGHQFTTEGAPFECDDCHLQGISTFNRSICAECHLAIDAAYLTDHTLTFGDSCLDCHDGVDRYGDFDHSKVSFTLTGAHTQVACSGCHLNARTIAELQNTPTACEACHLSDDAHQGRFGAACGVCHSPEAWKPATFDHSLSMFPLEGAHVDVECAACHRNEVYQGTPTECAVCHAEPAYHADMFPGQACSDCHTTTAWSPARYEGPHSFPMDHGEADNACADCHQPSLTTWTCYTCHERAEVEEEHLDEGIRDFGDCLSCHPTGQEDEAEGDSNGDD